MRLRLELTLVALNAAGYLLGRLAKAMAGEPVVKPYDATIAHYRATEPPIGYQWIDLRTGERGGWLPNSPGVAEFVRDRTIVWN